jgi:hypothetical protein
MMKAPSMGAEKHLESLFDKLVEGGGVKVHLWWVLGAEKHLESLFDKLVEGGGVKVHLWWVSGYLAIRPSPTWESWQAPAY